MGLPSVGDFLDTEKWLMQYGMMSDAVKNDITVYGYIIHPTDSINDVEVDIYCEEKRVEYKIWLKKKLYRVYNTYCNLNGKDDILSLIRLWYLCKRYGRLSFVSILQGFIRDRCGTDWTVKADFYEGKNATKRE